MTRSKGWLGAFQDQQAQRRQRVRTARHSLFHEIAEGAGRYRRERDLPRLLPIEPALLADDSPATRRHILMRLARALRGERNRGRAGHWTYDLNRHIGLRQAYKAERRRLAEQNRAGLSRRIG